MAPLLFASTMVSAQQSFDNLMGEEVKHSQKHRRIIWKTMRDHQL